MLRSRAWGCSTGEYSSNHLTIISAATILKYMLNQSVAIDRVFTALADPTRRAIVSRLSRGPASVSEIAAPLRMSLAAVVQHIQILEQSDVIRTQKQGRVRTCRIEPTALAGVEQWLKDRRLMWESQFDLLGEVLRQEKAAGSTGKDES